MSEAKLDDLIAIIIKLSHRLKKASPADEWSEKAMDYLRRHDLLPSPLRQRGAR